MSPPTPKPSDRTPDGSTPRERAPASEPVDTPKDSPAPVRRVADETVDAPDPNPGLDGFK